MFGADRSSPLRIAAASAVDAQALRQLHVETWEATYAIRGEESWYRARLADHRRRDWREVVGGAAARGGGVLRAECEGQLTGLCEYGPTADVDDDPEQVGQVCRLYVRPTHQRRGIGRALLGSAVEHLRRDRSEATLWVLETDRGARAFYERLGWRPDGMRQDHPPVDVRYRLRLT